MSNFQYIAPPASLLFGSLSTPIAGLRQHLKLKTPPKFHHPDEHTQGLPIPPIHPPQCAILHPDTVFSNITAHVPQLLRSPRNLTVLGFAIAAAASITSYLLTRKRLTEAEREQLRREHLALTGRITDGSITETHWLADPTSESGTAPQSNTSPPSHTDTPAVLLYRYQIAGVTYEAAQDVSPLPNLVRQVRVDLPIQVPLRPPQPWQQHRSRRSLERPPLRLSTP